MTIDFALSHGMFRAPSWMSQLRNCYYSIRAARTPADRRAAYRRARVEKDRLLSLGYDAELVRLACRYFKTPSDPARAVRCAARLDHLLNPPSDPPFTGRQVWTSHA